MPHFASKRFWTAYGQLPSGIQELADRAYRVLEQNPRHPSLQLKRVGPYWSARVGAEHRALAIEIEEGMLWFWIGRHDEYERLIRG